MRPVSLLIGVACLLTTALLRTAAAQVGPGDRVRVTTPDIERYDGTVQAIRGDFLTVDTLTVPRASITRLEVHRGRKGQAHLGAAIGAVALGAAGVAVGIAFCEGFECPKGEGAAVGGGAGVLVGGLLGLGIGALTKSDRWEEVPLDQLRVSFAPHRDGRLAFGFSWRF